MANRRRSICAVAFCLLACAIAIFSMGHTRSQDSRLSAAVAFTSSGTNIERFLQKPGKGYVQAYLRFGTDMAEDVIMTIDQELLEGISHPLSFKGADWMALVGVQRSGIVWVATGTQETERGVPSKDRAWKIFDLKSRLQPDTWYKVRTEVDFSRHHFHSFTIEGPGLKRVLDLNNLTLDYPNYMPFDSRSMTYYVAAMRGRSMMKREGTPIVYFDDVEAGIEAANGQWDVVFTNDFEKQKEVTKQPVTLPTIKIANYEQGTWYLEREEALFKIEEASFAHSGKHIGVADVHLGK